jgi:hypothetical protein
MRAYLPQTRIIRNPVEDNHGDGRVYYVSAGVDWRFSGGLSVVRGFLIVAVTLVVLIATVVGVVGAGMRRIAAAQKQADADWQPPAPVAVVPATNPAEAVPAADEQPIIPTFDTIDLGATDATLHGNVSVAELKSAKGRARGDVSIDGRISEKMRQRMLMGGRPISTYLTGFNTADDYAEWKFDLSKPGECEIDLTSACLPYMAGRHFVVVVNAPGISESEIPFLTESTRGEGNFRVFSVGKIALPAGHVSLIVRPKPTSIREKCFLNLRGVQVIPPRTPTP